MKALLLVWFFVLSFSFVVDSKRILALSPFFGKSHTIFTTAIFEELAKRGHHVTVITSNPIKNPPENYTQIITKSESHLNSNDTSILFNIDKFPTLLQTPVIWKGFLDATESSLNTPAVQDFIKNDNSHFDLIISELFFQEAYLMFSHKYKAPIVLLDSSTYFSEIDAYMGNPNTLSYIGHEFTKDIGGGTLYERFFNHFIGYIYILGKKFYLSPRQNMIALKAFKNITQPLPGVEELEKKVSVVFLNTHFTFDNIRPTVPGIVEIGGVHIKAPKKLPENIQKFLDEAENGVILLSFGSQLKSYQLEESKKQAFFSVIGNLKQRVIWKWEDDNPPTHLKNVLTVKWIPQSDILAHPNLIAFISHAGMLSILEAVYYGVPVIGIPVYGDQFMNIAKIERRGMGISLPLDLLCKKTLSDATDRIVNDKTYSSAAKAVSMAYHDQIKTPMETAMHWIEYVIKHGGATFMKSPAVNMAWYKYYNVDVIFVFLILAYLIIKLNIFLCKYAIRKFKNLFVRLDENNIAIDKKKA